ncbi:hypothetical protein [Azospirillum argentinense]
MPDASGIIKIICVRNQPVASRTGEPPEAGIEGGVSLGFAEARPSDAVQSRCGAAASEGGLESRRRVGRRQTCGSLGSQSGKDVGAGVLPDPWQWSAGDPAAKQPVPGSPNSSGLHPAPAPVRSGRAGHGSAAHRNPRRWGES